jgi:hypothetical protein
VTGIISTNNNISFLARRREAEKKSRQSPWTLIIKAHFLPWSFKNRREDVDVIDE